MIPNRTRPRPSGKLIRQARLAAGLNPMELSRATGLHHQTIRRYENGQRIPTALAAAKIAKALGRKYQEFYEANGDAA